MAEKMLQVLMRVDILDKMKEYISRVNKSGKLLHIYKSRQFVAEAILEYIEKHPEK